jgi:hypothetical protein
VRNSGEAFADELPQQVVAYAARRMGPGSRIQLVRRLPLVCCHLIYASPGDGDGRVPRLMLGRWARPGWDRDDPRLHRSPGDDPEAPAPTPVPTAPVLVGATSKARMREPRDGRGQSGLRMTGLLRIVELTTDL